MQEWVDPFLTWALQWSVLCLFHFRPEKELLDDYPVLGCLCARASLEVSGENIHLSHFRESNYDSSWPSHHTCYDVLATTIRTPNVLKKISRERR